MSKNIHFLYIFIMSAIVVVVTAYLSYIGYSFYILPEEERFYHEQYSWFKSSGILGQGLGILGTFLITFGVVIYIARKKYGFLERFVRVKHLLEFHIFLCVIGPILVLFHTAFKFGGIVSIAFWSMVAIVASGVAGRFIYVRIPRNVKGQALDLKQIQEEQRKILEALKEKSVFTLEELEKLQDKELSSNHRIKYAREIFIKNKVKKDIQKQVLNILSEEKKLTSRIKNLTLMKTMFKYWHVIHKPFAIIMLVIVIVHITVTITLGYKWIF